MGTSGAVV